MGRVRGREVNPRGQGGRLRAELVDAAGRLLATGGRDTELTLRAIAREAGVAAPSVYDHFHSLDALLEELVAGYRDELVAAVRHAPARGGASRAGAQLRAAARGYVRWGVAHPGEYLLACTAPVLRRSGYGLRPAVGGDWILPAFGELAQRLEPAPPDPRGAALALWSGLHGVVDLRTATPGAAWPALNRHVDTVLGDLVG